MRRRQLIVIFLSGIVTSKQIRSVLAIRFGEKSARRAGFQIQIIAKIQGGHGSEAGLVSLADRRPGNAKSARLGMLSKRRPNRQPMCLVATGSGNMPGVESPRWRTDGPPALQHHNATSERALRMWRSRLC